METPQRRSSEELKKMDCASLVLTSSCSRTAFKVAMKTQSILILNILVIMEIS